MLKEFLWRQNYLSSNFIWPLSLH